MFRQCKVNFSGENFRPTMSQYVLVKTIHWAIENSRDFRIYVAARKEGT